MWDIIARFILRNRIACLVGLGLFTVLMGFFAGKAELAYDMQKIVPLDDPEHVAYTEFKKTFGEDGNKVVLGFHTDSLFSKELFNDFYTLGENISKDPSVIGFLSPAQVYNLEMDTNGMFAVAPLVKGRLSTQTEVDSIADIFYNMKFYDGLLYNSKTKVALAVISLNDSALNTRARVPLVNKIKELSEAFASKHKVEMHYSGLPFIRTEFSTSVRFEVILFTIISFLITAIIILIFFRSMSTLAISLLFISIGVVTMLGVTGMLGYKLTLLTATLPPVLVVIGVQNTIYFINKYHEEYRKHGNKAKALTRIISKTGVATFLINFTTAIGFGTFYFTNSPILEQFGIVAFITINLIFFVNIIGIPALYSFLPAPTEKQTSHLEASNINNFLSWVRFNAFNHKRRIYFWTAAITLLSSIYILKLRPLAYMVDDVPHSSKIYQDLEFFQKNFDGVMPFEIIITCNEPGEARSATVLNKVNSLHKRIRQSSDFSKPMSVAEIVSFANQAYNEGDVSHYRVPNAIDLGNITSMIPAPQPGRKNFMNGMIDTAGSKVRISYQMKDVGSQKMDTIVKEVRKIAEDIFPKSEYNVAITGTSAIFLKGNSYLYESLMSSTLWALLIISLMMGLLFPSIKMIIISIIPNILPLFVTAGLMGYFHIPLKPSTILVFSIAFGITIDATIHFMSTFRRELIHTGKTLREALSHTIIEVGLSMIYTMVALFAGFMIFVFSSFQGTQALGWLTAVTLFTGLAANLFLLPALILSFEKSLNPKEEFKDAIVEMDEEDEEENG